MEFALPEHIKMAVAQYDPVLKATLAAERRRNNPSKKSQFPLGQPVGLFPAEILDPKTEAKMVAEINAAEAADRYKLAHQNGACCVLVHHQGLWMSIWTTADKDADYLYGFRCAWKSAPSTHSKVQTIYTNQNAAYRYGMKENPKEAKFGKTNFYLWGNVITEDLVRQGHHNLPWWPLLDRWGKYSREKAIAVENAIFNTLKTRLPIWEDSNNIFERMILQSNPAAIAFDRYGLNDTELEWDEETIRQRLSLPAKILDTPFFRRKIAETLASVQSLATDPDVTYKSQVSLPWKYLHHQCRFVERFTDIYPEASLDYIQQMYEIGRVMDPPWRNDYKVNEWLRLNMPIASWVGLFATERDKFAGRNADREDADRRLLTHGFNDLNDTLNMLGAVLRAKEIEEVGRPSRWRIADFHDYFTQEAFKVQTADEPLNQDLFPVPVRIDHLGSRWTFFQPNSVHQLAQWGASVRNCVGSATNYRDGIKRKTHFIVLAMIDNKPQFTVQLRVRNGSMSVDQIAGVGNRRLDDQERSSYELTFAAALNKQNEILAGGAVMN